MVLDVAGSSPVGRPNAPPVPAVILAGGASRRMGGGDKPLRTLASRPILAHVLARLRPAHPLVAINANGDPARFDRFGCPVIADPLPGLGPLGGVLAALDWAATMGADAVLTVPGDSPFLPADLAARLAPAPARAASASGRVHPPVGLWPVDRRAALRALLAAAAASGEGRGPRLDDWGRAVSARAVAFPAGADGADPFADVDTPDALARAEARCARATPC